MTTSVSSPSKSEGGFTLIELLIVMVIIGILVAIAVPTFLGQRNKAAATKALANIKNIVTAVESCSTSATDTAAPYSNCSSSDLEGMGSLSFKSILSADATSTNQFQVKNNSDNYMVQTVVKEGSLFVFYAEIHDKNGKIYRLCQPGTPFSETATAPTVALPIADLGTTSSCNKTTGTWGAS